MDFQRAVPPGTVTIVKVNNGDPSFTPRVTRSTISIAVMGDEPDGESAPPYIWERIGINDADWVEFTPDPPNEYSVPLQNQSNTLYRVSIAYRDAQGYTAVPITFGPYRLRIDIDDDDDGLIDIYYLEDLDKVRYQTDGTAYKESSTADEITAGCPRVGVEEVCNGYELRRDLDFASTQSYINAATNKSKWTVDNFETNDGTDTGWDPIRKS